MNRWGRYLPLLAIALTLLAHATPQARHDPLTDSEIDELRDAAQEPAARLQLYLKFSRARLTAVEQAFSAKGADRAKQTHDRLQSFLDVYDELNDNIETFVDRKADLRKPLKLVIDGDTEFQAKLRAIQSSGTVSKQESATYDFVLSNALDTVDSSAQDHRQLLAEQEEQFKHKKKQ